MGNRVSAKAVKRALDREEKARAAYEKAIVHQPQGQHIPPKRPETGKFSDANQPSSRSIGPTTTSDSFNNFAQSLGVGTDNVSSGGTYGFNPVTRERVKLEWIHRGSWIGGVAIDIVADDMTKMGVTMKGDLKPDQKEEIEELAVALDVWGKTNQLVKWSRLYGGAIMVLMIGGQNYETPLRIETIGKDQFKGVVTLDRWMVEPDISNLVTEEGPHMGMPKFYRVTAQSPTLRGKKIHYTRVIRMIGIELPYWQMLQENYWGESILERLYDRLVAFDSATQGAAQLVYKAYIRTYKIKGLRDIVTLGGEALGGVLAYIDLMRRTQGVEGVTLLDAEDEFEPHTHNAFSGLSDILVHFGQQIGGALQIPLVRLFGQSPTGMNASGESDMRTYFDGIQQQQNRHLKWGMTMVYRALAQSCGIAPPKGFGIKFKDLWQLTELQKSALAKEITETVAAGVEAGLALPSTGQKELRAASDKTDVWANITDEEIAEMEKNEVAQAPEFEGLSEKEEIAEIKEDGQGAGS